MTICNVRGMGMENTYLENNGGNSVTFPGTCTYAQALSFTGDYIWGASGDELVFGTSQMGGSITGTFLATNNSFVEQSTWSVGVIDASGNSDAGTHSIVSDGGGGYHLSINGALPLNYYSTTGTVTPSVTGLNYLNFSNASPTTVTNFAGGDPGQIVQVFNGGSSTVIFQSSNTSGMPRP